MKGPQARVGIAAVPSPQALPSTSPLVPELQVFLQMSCSGEKAGGRVDRG